MILSAGLLREGVVHWSDGLCVNLLPERFLHPPSDKKRTLMQYTQIATHAAFDLRVAERLLQVVRLVRPAGVG